VPPCATSEVVRLNASALSDPNSLRLSLTSSLISDSSSVISALVDSGSTHCFVDTEFVHFYNLPLVSVSPIELKLFDGDVQLSHVPTLNAYFSIYKHAYSPQRYRVIPRHSRGPIANRAIMASFTRTSRFSYYVLTARSPILCTRVHGRLSDDGFRISTLVCV
jgi:hypothetical protein